MPPDSQGYDRRCRRDNSAHVNSSRRSIPEFRDTTPFFIDLDPCASQQEAADDTDFAQWRSASACDYLSNTSWLWNSCTGSPNQHDVVVDALLLPAILTSVVEKVAALGLNF